MSNLRRPVSLVLKLSATPQVNPTVVTDHGRAQGLDLGGLFIERSKSLVSVNRNEVYFRTNHSKIVERLTVGLT